MIVGGRYRQLLATSPDHFPTLMTQSLAPVYVYFCQLCLDVDMMYLIHLATHVDQENWKAGRKRKQVNSMQSHVPSLLVEKSTKPTKSSLQHADANLAGTPQKHGLLQDSYMRP